MTALQWADAHLSSAHRNAAGKLHGHTWRVRAFWPHDGTDVLERQRLLRKWASALDHRELPAHLTLSEDLAGHLGAAVKACRVEVWREAEGLGAVWIAQTKEIEI